MALLDYSEKGIAAHFDGVLGMAYTTMAQQVDFDASTWSDKCQRNSENRRSKETAAEDKNHSQERSTMVNDGDHNKTEQHSNKTEQHNIMGVEKLFEEFWSCYPKKKGKDAARRSFEKALQRTDLRTLLSALEQQKASVDWKKDGGQFIPHPSTWLNQGRWMDETDMSAQPSQNKEATPGRVVDYDAMELDENGVPIGLEEMR